MVEDCMAKQKTYLYRIQRIHDTMLQNASYCTSCHVDGQAGGGQTFIVIDIHVGKNCCQVCSECFAAAFTVVLETIEVLDLQMARNVPNACGSFSVVWCTARTLYFVLFFLFYFKFYFMLMLCNNSNNSPTICP